MSDLSTFQKYAGDFGNYSFFIIFVKADAGAVAEAYAKATGQPLHRNIPVTASKETGYAPIGGVVGLSDSDWTTVFHRVGSWESFDAGKIARDLKTDILVFQAEDTSGSIGCELIVPGSPLRRLFTAPDAETQIEYWEMSDQEPPPYEIIGSYVELFESLGIRTVQPYCKEDRSVVSDAADTGRITKFHFVGETPWA